MYRDRLNAAWAELGDAEAQVKRMVTALRSETAPVLVIGNGGSQSTGAHLVLHLRENGIRALDMMADNAYLTMLSNDYSYDTATGHMTKLFWDSPLFIISGSGDSANILNLAQPDSRSRKYGLLGNMGGQAWKFCDMSIVLSTADYSIIEDIHLSLVHMISEGLRGRS